jgi:hypothetical protein
MFRKMLCHQGVRVKDFLETAMPLPQTAPATAPLAMPDCTARAWVRTALARRAARGLPRPRSRVSADRAEGESSRVS